MLGIHSAINFSLKFKLLSKLNYSKIKDHFIKYKLPNKITNYFLKKDLKRLIYFMKKDKKNTSNLINLILIERIGRIKLNLNFNEKVLSKFFEEELNN